MAYIGPVRRWDLFWVDLEPHVGSEQGGERRPAVVVSNDGVNAQLSVVTVLSATSAEGKQRKPYSFEVVLPEGMITAGRRSIIMPQQIRTISKWRLLEKIGQLHDVVMQREIENRLLEHLGIQFEAEGLEPSM
jgi:mRNA interferase MazF